MIRIMLSVRLGERRMTQTQLSRKTGIRKNTIGIYYNELSDRVNLEHMDKICDVLGIELTDLLVRVKNDPIDEE